MSARARMARVSSPRATPSFISARQQGTQTPAALLKLLQSCQSSLRGTSADSDALPAVGSKAARASPVRFSSRRTFLLWTLESWIRNNGIIRKAQKAIHGDD